MFLPWVEMYRTSTDAISEQRVAVVIAINVAVFFVRYLRSVGSPCGDLR